MEAEKPKLYVNCPRCSNIIYESRFYPKVEVGKKIKCQNCGTIFVIKEKQSNLNVNMDEIKDALQERKNRKGQELDIVIVDYKPKLKG